MSGLRAVLVDAFTRVPGLGNRAALIPDAEGLDEQAMMRIAAATSAAATAFLLPPLPGGSVRMRAFTPVTEIPFCGHATVAVFHWLSERGSLASPGRHVLDAAAGRIEIDLEPAEEGGARIWMAPPRFPWEPNPVAGATLMGLLGGSQAMRDSSLPLERAGRHLYVALSKRVDLWSLTPRWDALVAETERHGIHGFYVFTRDVADVGSASHGRYFVPTAGIREDTATGSASGPLAEYLARHGVIALPPGGGISRARAEQGDAIGKPGRVELEVRGSGASVEAVRVGGTAVTVLEGTLRV